MRRMTSSVVAAAAAASTTLADRTEHCIASVDDIARTGHLIDVTRSSCGHALNERSITAKWIRKHTAGAKQETAVPADAAAAPAVATAASASDGRDKKKKKSADDAAQRTRITTSQLLFVDLAGSERVNKSGVAVDGGTAQARVLHIPGSAPLAGARAAVFLPSVIQNGLLIGSRQLLLICLFLCIFAFGCWFCARVFHLFLCLLALCSHMYVFSVVPFGVWCALCCSLFVAKIAPQCPARGSTRRATSTRRCRRSAA